MTDLRAQLQSTLGDGYTLERELGGGGMSRVFVARDKARAVSLLDFRTFNNTFAHYDLIREWLPDHPPFQELITPRG